MVIHLTTSCKKEKSPYFSMTTHRIPDQDKRKDASMVSHTISMAAHMTSADKSQIPKCARNEATGDDTSNDVTEPSAGSRPDILNSKQENNWITKVNFLHLKSNGDSDIDPLDVHLNVPILALEDSLFPPPDEDITASMVSHTINTAVHMTAAGNFL